jgi:amidase
MLESSVPGAVRSERGLSISDDSLDEAGTIAREWSALLEDLFENRYDAIDLPLFRRMGLALGSRRATMDSYHRWMEVVVPVSLAGLRGVTVPAARLKLKRTTNTCTACGK